MIRRKTKPEHPLLHTVEEATELLRRCGLGAWAWWFAGSAPFAVALLHFINDMSTAAKAETRLVGSALVLGLLYWWMKVAQAVFGDHLLRLLRGDETPEPLPLRGKLRFVTSLAVIHCTVPWVLPLSLFAMLPFGWAYATYHNVSTLALSVFRKGGGTRDLVRAAIAQANYRQGQNHGLMLILLTLTCVVWFNWHLGIFMSGVLAKIFTGAENAISRNPLIVFTSGIFSATLTATYLVMGPFVKALYALRCFYGLSRRNGEDLEVAFRATSANVALLATALLFSAPPLGFCSEHEAPRSKPTTIHINPDKLGHSINEVMQKDAFQWRMPRDDEANKNSPKGWVASFADEMGTWINKAIKWLNDGFDRWMKSMFKGWGKSQNGDEFDLNRGGGASWAYTAALVMKGLLIVLGALLALLLLRQWRNIMPKAAAGAGVSPPEVNLESESVLATQLPENEWLRMAEEKINAGEYRLGMRALFLATLAHLGERQVLTILKSKSNGDYVRELSLRARDQSDLRMRFSDSVRTFDWAWYGWHNVTRDLLEQFRDNHQHIIANAARR